MRPEIDLRLLFFFGRGLELDFRGESQDQVRLLHDLLLDFGWDGSHGLRFLGRLVLKRRQCSRRGRRTRGRTRGGRKGLGNFGGDLFVVVVLGCCLGGGLLRRPEVEDLGGAFDWPLRVVGRGSGGGSGLLLGGHAHSLQLGTRVGARDQRHLRRFGGLVVDVAQIVWPDRPQSVLAIDGVSVDGDLFVVVIGMGRNLKKYKS